MNNLPKITIVTPSYNQGQFLRETIESVLGQDYPNLEYFIVDGGSTDNSIEIIREYEDRIDWWVSEKDNGQSDAINKGFKRATGEYLTWMNSDDILLPDTLNNLAKSIMKNPGTEWVTGNVISIDSRSQIIRCSRLPANSKLFEKMGRIFVSGPATFFSKRLYNNVYGLREEHRFSMDIDLWWQFIKHGVYPLHIHEYLMAFRIHALSKTSSTLHDETINYSANYNRLPLFYKPQYVKGQKEERNTIIKRYGNTIIGFMLAGQLHRIRQFLNGNYLKAYRDLNKMQGKNWHDVFINQANLP